MKFKLRENSVDIETLPGNNGNAYSSSKRLYNSIKVDKENIIESYNPIDEGIDWTVDDNEKGGMIILSTDVNAVQQDENKVIDWFKKKIKTIKNRITSTKKIDKISQKNELVGWTIGKFLNGRYTSHKGVPFGENSLSIEIVGITSELLIKIAEELCEEFGQESVMVKDYTTGNIHFVNCI